MHRLFCGSGLKGRTAPKESDRYWREIAGGLTVKLRRIKSTRCGLRIMELTDYDFFGNLIKLIKEIGGVMINSYFLG